MKNLLKLEEAAMFSFSIVLFTQTDFAWWWYALLIFAPDIGMVGYAAGQKTGAWIYNFFHHKAVALLFLCLGFYAGNAWIELAGIILFGHSSLDRILGYGLKYLDSFQHTHLGWIGSEGKS